MYLFAGATTIVWSFVILSLVPDSPTQLGWFGSFVFKDEEERELLRARMKRRERGLRGGRFTWAQAREAAQDVKTWSFFLMGAAIYVGQRLV